MSQRPTILLLIPYLGGGGGAEQVTSLLACGLSPEKYDIHLAVITQSASPVAFPAWVTVHCLGTQRVHAAALPLLRLVRRLRPALILSNMAHLNFLVLLLRPFFPAATRVLVRQNATVSASLAAGDLPAWTGSFYRVLYPRADRVICQSAAMATDLVRELRLDPARIAVLPNPVDVSAIRAAASSPEPWPGPGPHLLAVGRLVPEKGFDLLLHALISVRALYPTVTLTILGAGRNEAGLKSLARSLGFEHAVRFPGHVSPPYRYFPGATLFVLSSRTDAMPNALLEAAAAGLPVVATPASGGVADLLAEQPGVWLASTISASALAAALIAALQAIQPGVRFQRSLSPVPPQATPKHAVLP